MDVSQETDAVTRDPARMAASIRALARSVHGNTSEIFGELPRPPTRSRTTSQRTGPRRWHRLKDSDTCTLVDIAYWLPSLGQLLLYCVLVKFYAIQSSLILYYVSCAAEEMLLVVCSVSAQ